MASSSAQSRGIGRGGTLARAVVGSALLADVIVAHTTGGWPLDSWVLALVASMLLAAVRGYPGCEVLAVSNWILRRDDQVGCAVFFPVDVLEHRHEASPATDLSAALREVD